MIGYCHWLEDNKAGVGIGQFCLSHHVELFGERQCEAKNERISSRGRCICGNCNSRVGHAYRICRLEEVNYCQVCVRKGVK